jgi:hypothetical protein
VVFTEHQSNEIFGGCMHRPWNSKHIDVDMRCGEDPAGRTWRKLLGRPVPEAQARDGPVRRAHPLVIKADALRCKVALEESSTCDIPQADGYLLGSYRIATAPEPNSSRLTRFKST